WPKSACRSVIVESPYSEAVASVAAPSIVDAPRAFSSLIVDTLWALCEYPRHLVSRIVETPPIGLVDGRSAFLNLAAAVPWHDETAALKKRLVAIEVALGRDRADRRSSVKSRTADI